MTEKELPKISPQMNEFLIKILSCLSIIFFVFISPIFFKTRIIKMTKGQKTVWLVGMCHVANQKFYDKIKNYFSDLSFKNSIVLYEKVTDVNKLISRDKTIVDRVLNPVKKLFVSQPTSEQLFLGQPIHGDIDFSELPKEAQTFISATDFNELLKLDIDTFKKSMSDGICEGRNEVLIKRFIDNYEKSDVFLMPWGNLHLKGLQINLEEKGFISKHMLYLRPFGLFTNIISFVKGQFK